MKLSIVVGNPKSASRTRIVAEAVAARVAGATGAEVVRTIDLCDYADRLLSGADEELDALGKAVADSDLVVFASPVYKAAYTGLLKAFLDRYPSNGLAGVTAVAAMTGGTELHGLAVETSLRPVLVELGASLPTRGFFLYMERMDELDQVADQRAAENLGTASPLGPAERAAPR